MSRIVKIILTIVQFFKNLLVPAEARATGTVPEFKDSETVAKAKAAVAEAEKAYLDLQKAEPWAGQERKLRKAKAKLRAAKRAVELAIYGEFHVVVDNVDNTVCKELSAAMKTALVAVRSGAEVAAVFNGNTYIGAYGRVAAHLGTGCKPVFENDKRLENIKAIGLDVPKDRCFFTVFYVRKDGKKIVSKPKRFATIEEANNAFSTIIRKADYTGVRQVKLLRGSDELLSWQCQDLKDLELVGKLKTKRKSGKKPGRKIVGSVAGHRHGKLRLPNSFKAEAAPRPVKENTEDMRVPARSYEAFEVSLVPCFEPSIIKIVSDFTEEMKSAKADKPENLATIRKEILVRMANELLPLLESKVNYPYLWPAAQRIGRTRLYESELADVIGVNYDAKVTQNSIWVINHDTWNVVESFAPFGWLGLDTIKEQIADLLLNRYVRSGINVGGTRLFNYTASAADLKVGAALACSENCWRQHGDALNFLFGAEREERMNRKFTGAELLKVRAVSTSKSVSLSRITMKEETITVDNVIVLRDAKFNFKLKNVLAIDKNGKAVLKEELDHNHCLFDGQMLVIDGEGDGVFPDSAQVRMARVVKSFAVRTTWSTMRDIYARFGEKMPETISDMWGKSHAFGKGVVVIITESCIKGLKWFGSTTETPWEHISRVAKETGVAELRVCNWASEPKDDRRKVSRQLIQQLFTADNGDIAPIVKRNVKILLRAKDPDVVMAKLQERDAEDGKESRKAKLFRELPEAVGIPEVYDRLAHSWDVRLATACVKPSIREAGYSYIATDIVAFVGILLLNKTPEEAEFLKRNEVSVPGRRDGQETFLMRHPANMLTGVVLKNRNSRFYHDSGNVVFLPVYPEVIIRCDGDFDGDEALWSTDHFIVKLFKDMITRVHPWMIDFPHDKAPDVKITSGSQMATEIAKAMRLGQEYYLVGKYSNLATKLLNKLRPWMGQPDNYGPDYEYILRDAAVAHVLTILMIDSMKTGLTPVGLVKKATEIQMRSGKGGANQAFVNFLKHNRESLERNNGDIDWTESVADRVAAGIYYGAGQRFDMPRQANLTWWWLIDQKLAQKKLDANGKEMTALIMCPLPVGNYGFVTEAVNPGTKNAFANSKMEKLARGEQISPLDIMKLYFIEYSNLQMQGGDNCASKQADCIERCLASMYMAVEDGMRNMPSKYAKYGGVDSATIMKWIATASLRDLYRTHDEKELKSSGISRKDTYFDFLLLCFGDVYAEMAKANKDNRWTPGPNAAMSHFENEEEYEPAPLPTEAEIMAAPQLEDIDSCISYDEDSNDIDYCAEAVDMGYTEAPVQESPAPVSAPVEAPIEAPAAPAPVPAAAKVYGVDIYTDGACSGNPGPGGYYAILVCNGNEKIVEGREVDTTNNRMELRAVVEAISGLKTKSNVTIHSDSAYVVNAVEKGWVKKWLNNGWKKADKKPVENKDLWEQLITVSREKCASLKFVKVAGHAGDTMNERCDKGAVKQRDMAKAEAKAE